MTTPRTTTVVGPWVALGVLALVAPAPARAQLELSGQLDLVGTLRADSLNLNQGMRGDNPFNRVRLRLYARRWITDRIGVFTEVLYDIDTDVRINGAYVVINELAGQSWLNARLGLAPNVVGSFGLRSTYFNSNPLVGVPLVWQYRTNLSAAGTSTSASLTGTAVEPGGGVPILYDSCWNIQWELLGELGGLEYSIGMTPGSLSNPNRSRSVPGSTWLARVGYTPIPSVRVGVSGARGPYLSKPTLGTGGALPYPDDPQDFVQTLVGGDVEVQAGAWVLNSEAYVVRWGTPLVSEDLDAVGAYAEARFDFATGWYAAARLDGLHFNEIVTDPQTRARAPWDRDTMRSELALGYRVAREVLLKLDWQRTTVPDNDFEQNIFAAQLSTVF